MAIVNTVQKRDDLKLEEESSEPKKSSKAVKKPAKKKADVKSANDKTVKELKIELQKLILDIKTSKESNTSLAKKLRKEIARKLTIENLK